MTLVANPCPNADNHSEFQLNQNEPNPFKEKTSIRYCVPYKTKVIIIVINSEGDVVEKLISKDHDIGMYEVEFFADGLAEGTYFYQIIAGNPSTSSGPGFSEIKKMTHKK